MRPCRAQRAVDGHKAGQRGSRGKARQEGDQAFSDGSTASVARLGQVWPDMTDMRDAW